jgi:hypothetical protein
MGMPARPRLVSNKMVKEVQYNIVEKEKFERQ